MFKAMISSSVLTLALSLTVDARADNHRGWRHQPRGNTYVRASAPTARGHVSPAYRVPAQCHVAVHQRAPRTVFVHRPTPSVRYNHYPRRPTVHYRPAYRPGMRYHARWIRPVNVRFGSTAAYYGGLSVQLRPAYLTRFYHAPVRAYLGGFFTRQDAMAQRVYDAYMSGTVSEDQYNTLMAELRSIEGLRVSYLSDGYLTSGEQLDLSQRQQNVDSQVATSSTQPNPYL
jgi:hypothetical protein